MPKIVERKEALTLKDAIIYCEYWLKEEKEASHYLNKRIRRLEIDIENPDTKSEHKYIMRKAVRECRKDIEEHENHIRYFVFMREVLIKCQRSA